MICDKERALDNVTTSKAEPRETENVDFYQIRDLLEAQKARLRIKRFFDVFVSVVGLLILLAFFIVIAIIIKIDSNGPVFFWQTRVGKYGKHFKIFKFRTMVVNAEKKGRLITVGDDPRITRVGGFLRKMKIDELPQIMNIIKGDMSFVGPRPEVPKYVELYNESQKQVLLVRPGVTDLASIEYKNEGEILALSDDPEKTYITVIMQSKLERNIQYLKKISLINDIRVMLKTVIEIIN